MKGIAVNSQKEKGKTPRVALPAVVEIGQIGHYKKGLT